MERKKSAREVTTGLSNMLNKLEIPSAKELGTKSNIKKLKKIKSKARRPEKKD